MTLVALVAFGLLAGGLCYLTGWNNGWDAGRKFERFDKSERR